MTTESNEQAAALTPIKRALVEIRDLKSRLAASENAQREPIAIVGMGLRFPGGARDAESFASLLWNGTDAITDIPGDRWSLDEYFDADPDAPARMITRRGGFIDAVDQFDAEFFGISPREAASMDPQQRVSLQVAWEALENAGYSPASLAGSKTGVYLGISNNDYGRAIYSDQNDIDPYFASGNAFSVAAGRISYLLGLHGPSMAVDTACSSSLVALHLACQALRSRECDVALAGGVNLILTPDMNITFTKARMMAPDGRCKTFDASADGYVRSEGCAFVVLRRLSEAVARRDNILAVVRGSAVNQDGRSGGLTAPNGPAQEAVIRAALEIANVAPRDVGYVEAHGTGTSLGDPIEVSALGAVYSLNRDSERPLGIGSVKTNIGHLESAAGIAGVVKVVLSLQRKEIPAHLNFTTGNPFIDWAALPVTVHTTVTPWAPINGSRFAGVSSFGFSGTNAHVILEEAPAPITQANAVDRPLHILALSARDEQSLLTVAASYASALKREDSVADFCYTANTGRSHFSHRVAVVGATASELRDGLNDFVSGRSALSVASGSRAGASKPRVAFLFTGQGAQSVGMGRQLYETSPFFRSGLDAGATALAPHLSRGLFDGMFGATNDGAINETSFAQPATFAIELALAQLWRHWGIEPEVVLGHSLGEYAAACFAGAFSLNDGYRLVAERGRLTQSLATDGAMAAVFAPNDVVAQELARANGALEIAAYNGPEHFVITGPKAAIETALQRLESNGVRVKMLRIAHAAHSAMIDGVIDPFRTVLETVRFSQPEVSVISNVSGELASADLMTNTNYWLQHMRKPVRFAQSIRAAQEMGITHFIEIGPHPVLLGMGAECLPGIDVQWLPSMRRDRDGWSDLLESLQRLYVDGADVNWDAFDSDYARRRVQLPTYPFRTRRHWIERTRKSSTQTVSTDARWERLSAALDRQSEQAPLDVNAASYALKWDCLARITDAHAVSVLRAAKLFAIDGERRTLDEVLAAAGIRETYKHLVHRWLSRLITNGTLRETENAYVADRALPAPPLDALWTEANALFADDAPVLAYVKQCATLAADVLTGKVSPLETIFPGGSFDLATQLYEQSGPGRYINSLAASALNTVASAMPEGRTLRVLEVGAGTGGTSSALLRVLSGTRVQYRFTDVSDAFLDRARERFSAYPFLEFGQFDLDVDIGAQGMSPASFDVIVAANAVHAVRDLRAALQRLRTLLAPGGVLVLVESTEHLTYFDLTTGLIEGWQHFADDLRTDNPLLSPSAWTSALGEAGFDRAHSWPSAKSVANVIGQHVIVARAPGAIEHTSVATSNSLSSNGDHASRATEQAAATTTVGFREQFNLAFEADRLDLLRDLIRTQVMRVLRLDASMPPARHDRLMDLGMDSLMAVQFRNGVTKALELEKPLSSTLMFDYPTIDDLAAFLLPQLSKTAVDTVVSTPSTASRTNTSERIGAERVAEMSDDEIAALLTKRLGGT